MDFVIARCNEEVDMFVSLVERVRVWVLPMVVLGVREPEREWEEMPWEILRGARGEAGALPALTRCV